MDPWQYMMNGEFAKAREVYAQRCGETPKAFDLHNLALALLNLGDLDGTLRCLERAERTNLDDGTVGDVQRTYAGAVHWLKGDEGKAADIWSALLNDHISGTIVYTDAAGGVVAACLAWFAGRSLNRAALAESAVRFLKKRLRSKQARAWPGAIGQFVLGRLPEEDLLAEAAKSEPLRQRHLCKAEFWAGAVAGVSGDNRRATDLLGSAAKSIALLEIEYYLARHEHGKRTRPLVPTS
jgi:hypothetical protein